MLTALAAAAAHPGFWHPVFFPFFFLIPIFWVVVIALVIFFIVRSRRRFWAHGGYGAAPWGGPWHHGAAARSAEATLAERFANGDIDEKEYRARLEVLRANNPVPPRP